MERDTKQIKREEKLKEKKGLVLDEQALTEKGERKSKKPVQFHIGCTVCGKQTGFIDIPTELEGLELSKNVDLQKLTLKSFGISDVRCDDHPPEPVQPEIKHYTKIKGDEASQEDIDKAKEKQGK